MPYDPFRPPGLSNSPGWAWLLDAATRRRSLGGVPEQVPGSVTYETPGLMPDLLTPEPPLMPWVPDEVAVPQPEPPRAPQEHWRTNPTAPPREDPWKATDLTIGGVPLRTIGEPINDLSRRIAAPWREILGLNRPPPERVGVDGELPTPGQYPPGPLAPRAGAAEAPAAAAGGQPNPLTQILAGLAGGGGGGGGRGYGGGGGRPYPEPQAAQFDLGPIREMYEQSRPKEETANEKEMGLALLLGMAAGFNPRPGEPLGATLGRMGASGAPAYAQERRYQHGIERESGRDLRRWQGNKAQMELGLQGADIQRKDRQQDLAIKRWEDLENSDYKKAILGIQGAGLDISRKRAMASILLGMQRGGRGGMGQLGGPGDFAAKAAAGKIALPPQLFNMGELNQRAMLMLGRSQGLLRSPNPSPTELDQLRNTVATNPVMRQLLQQSRAQLIMARMQELTLEQQLQVMQMGRGNWRAGAVLDEEEDD